ncbi:MAG: V-type ATPase subunit [Lachnospiraceae bacterium]|nr:V-type ATPase subunit [Lachnospiraceae bacterium]
MADNNQNYICLSAMLRARETRLLTAEKAARCCDAPSFQEAAKLLTECGYADMEKLGEAQIGETLENRLQSIFSEVYRLSPEKEPVDIFLAKYDCHNAKAIIKAEGAKSSPEAFLSRAGRVSPEKLKYAFNEENYRDIPPVLAAAMSEAKEILARTSNPQKADIILDRAFFHEITELAAKLGNEYIAGYVRLLIDAANLKTLVRCLKMKKNADFINDALICGGDIQLYRLTGVTDGETMAALFSQTRLGEAAAIGKDVISGQKMTRFELAVDNAVFGYFRDSRLMNYGPEAVAAYLAETENEITAVRMILTCRLAGVKPEIVKERLRDMYA